jgi:hypothetical protein
MLIIRSILIHFGKPIRYANPSRAEQAKVVVNMELEDDLIPGTVLITDGWKKNAWRMPKLPEQRMDICNFIAESYPNNTEVRCPMNQWASKLVMYAIQQFRGESDFIKPLVVPARRSFVGDFVVRVRLINPDTTVTCAMTTVQILDKQ